LKKKNLLRLEISTSTWNQIIADDLTNFEQNCGWNQNFSFEIHRFLEQLSSKDSFDSNSTSYHHSYLLNIDNISKIHQTTKLIKASRKWQIAFQQMTLPFEDFSSTTEHKTKRNSREVHEKRN
jgi:hypothetical protein